MVPSDDPFLCVDLLEHAVHDLQVLVVQEPDLAVSLVLVERQRERVRNVELKKQKTNILLSDENGKVINLLSWRCSVMKKMKENTFDKTDLKKPY